MPTVKQAYQQQTRSGGIVSSFGRMGASLANAFELTSTDVVLIARGRDVSLLSSYSYRRAKGCLNITESRLIHGYLEPFIILPILLSVLFSLSFYSAESQNTVFEPRSFSL